LTGTAVLLGLLLRPISLPGGAKSLAAESSSVYEQVQLIHFPTFAVKEARPAGAHAAKPFFWVADNTDVEARSVRSHTPPRHRFRAAISAQSRISPRSPPLMC